MLDMDIAQQLDIHGYRSTREEALKSGMKFQMELERHERAGTLSESSPSIPSTYVDGIHLSSRSQDEILDSGSAARPAH